MQELASLDIEAIKQFALKDWELGETHGLPHWQRVERNGIILATSEVNSRPLECAFTPNNQHINI